MNDVWVVMPTGNEWMTPIAAFATHAAAKAWCERNVGQTSELPVDETRWTPDPDAANQWILEGLIGSHPLGFNGWYWAFMIVRLDVDSELLA